MAALAGKVMPLSFLLLCGKEDYPAIYKGVFGKDPKFFPPRYLK
jgi:hypothetical protein